MDAFGEKTLTMPRASMLRLLKEAALELRHFRRDGHE